MTDAHMVAVWRNVEAVGLTERVALTFDDLLLGTADRYLDRLALAVKRLDAEVNGTTRVPGVFLEKRGESCLLMQRRRTRWRDDENHVLREEVPWRCVVWWAIHRLDFGEPSMPPTRAVARRLALMDLARTLGALEARVTDRIFGRRLR